MDLTVFSVDLAVPSSEKPTLFGVGGASLFGVKGGVASALAYVDSVDRGSCPVGEVGLLMPGLQRQPAA